MNVSFAFSTTYHITYTVTLTHGSCVITGGTYGAGIYSYSKTISTVGTTNVSETFTNGTSAVGRTLAPLAFGGGAKAASYFSGTISNVYIYPQVNAIALVNGAVSINNAGGATVFQPTSGLRVWDYAGGFGTWQSGSAIDGYRPNSDGTWNAWAGMWLNYYSTGDLYLNQAISGSPGRVYSYGRMLIDNTGTFTDDGTSYLQVAGVASAPYFKITTAPTANSTGADTILDRTATPTTNAGWLPIKKSDGTTVYIPYWS
jgi:hypothetical protein